MITCALWDIESRELDRRPVGPLALLSNYPDSISHSAHVIIVYPIQKFGGVAREFLDWIKHVEWLFSLSHSIAN